MMAPPAEAQQPRTGAPIGFGFHRIRPSVLNQGFVEEIAWTVSVFGKIWRLAEDLICGSGPEEWPRCGIVVGDEGGNRRLQFLDAAVKTAADLALGQKREPALDLIEPEARRE